MAGQTCRECGARFDGTRSEARRAGWEPWATRRQWDLDHGPMVCRPCVARIIDGALNALRNAGGIAAFD